MPGSGIWCKHCSDVAKSPPGLVAEISSGKSPIGLKPSTFVLTSLQQNAFLDLASRPKNPWLMCGASLVSTAQGGKPIPLSSVQCYPKSVSPQIFFHTHISRSSLQGSAYDLTCYVLTRKQASDP
jgi:hypothetical protein